MENFDETELMNIIDGSLEKIDYKITNQDIVESQQENQSTEVVEIPSQIDSNDAYELDFEYIRANLKDVIQNGSEALKSMIMVAKASNHPRAYEVVATLMNALVTSNKELLNSHKIKDERSGGINKVTNVQNNTVFVGSTKEFSKMMREKATNIEKDIELDE